MRVKLTTSCNMEEVPGVVVKTLLGVKTKLSSMSDIHLNYFSIQDLAAQINELRYRLSDLDQTLEEVHSIATGFSSALDAPVNEADDTEEELLDEEEKV